MFQHQTAFTTAFPPQTPAKVIRQTADRAIMDLSTIALQGLQQANAQLNSAASSIASFQSSTPTGANVDTVDLSAAVVALLSAKNLYSANLATTKTAEQISQSTLDILA
jgi:uncharacterized protein YjbI with pentapeptide repeats